FLGLGAELRVWNLDRNDRRQPLAGIVAGGGYLVLLGQAFSFDVIIQVARQGRAETGQVGTTVTLGNIVGEAQKVFVEAVIPLHSHFNPDTIFFALSAEMKDWVDDRLVG